MMLVSKKIAACIGAALIIVAIALLVGEYRLQQSTDNLQTFKDGVCTLVSHADKAASSNRAYYLGNVHRARVRLAADSAAGQETLVSADQDAIKSNLRQANASKAVHFPGC